MSILNRVQRAWQALTTDSSPKRGYWGGYNDAHGWADAGINRKNNFVVGAMGSALAYQAVPDLRAAVDVIAENLATVPLVVRDEDGNEVARSDHNPDDSAALKMLMEAHAGEVPLMQAWGYSQLLYGFTVVEKVMSEGDGRKRITGLEWLNPLMLSLQDPHGYIDEILYSGYGRFARYERDEVIYTRVFGPMSEERGYAPVWSVLAKANLALDFDRFVLAFMDNGGVPGVIATPKNGHDISTDDIKRLTDLWRREFKGVNNFFKPYITTHPMDYEVIDMQNFDKVLPMEDRIIAAIQRMLRVPPSMLGDSKDSPYQFSSDKKNSFMQTAVKPYAGQIEGALNKYFMPLAAPWGHTAHFDFSVFEPTTEMDERRRAIAERDWLTAGITLGEYRERRGETPYGGALDDLVFVPGFDMPVPKSEVGELWRYRLPMLGKQNSGGSLPELSATGPPNTASGLPSLRGAPAQTTFSPVTYNGVTVQASPVQPSSRDDKKFMRWVRYDEQERLVHWGQPGEDMERDNDEARENFMARHNCDEKRDPFRAGFWACWAWQPSAEVRTTGCGHDHARDVGMNVVDAIEVQPLPDNGDMHEEIDKWCNFKLKRYKQKNPRAFNPEATRGDLGDWIQAQLEQAKNTPEAIQGVFEAAHERVRNAEKAIQATRLLYEGEVADLIEAARSGDITRRQFSARFRSRNKTFGRRAYEDGITDGGVDVAEMTSDDFETMNNLIAEQSQYVSRLGAVLYDEGISDAEAARRPALWFKKSIMPLYEAGLLSAAGDQMVEWVMNGAAENCDSCQALNGQRHRRSTFHSNGFVPGDNGHRSLICGMGCKCRFVPVQGKARGRLRGIPTR